MVSFDVPDPPNYGGVIDVFYKLKALSDLGIKIHLHCFQYGRGSTKQLEEICESVTYYKRKKLVRYALSKTPFIVESRKNPQLLKNLQASKYPILFEGLHTTAYINHSTLKNRTKFVRAHNIEHDYYMCLANVERNPIKKLFLKVESHKLKRYESVLMACQYILAISENDKLYFQKKYSNTILINPFHSFDNLEISGKNAYAFYHGNLQVSENIDALKYIINKVLPFTDVPLMVAGKGATNAVGNLQSTHEIEVVESPDSERMLQLARNASVHVLPTFQSSGFKLKLLYSMFTARHIVANKKMVNGTGLAGFCRIAETPKEIAKLITEVHNAPIDKAMINARMAYLKAHFSNRENALIIKKLL